MTELNVAAEKNDESLEARDVVELGEVSEDTKGFVGGNFYDGAGYWG